VIRKREERLARASTDSARRDSLPRAGDGKSGS